MASQYKLKRLKTKNVDCVTEFIGKKHGLILPKEKFINIYGGKDTFIGWGTKIGAFVEIQKGVKIGRRCVISSHSFVCDGVELKDDVFVGHSVVFTNDKKPIAFNPNWKKENIVVHHFASIGSNATLIGPLDIGGKSIIGAGAVVTKDVPINEIWVGNPAKKL